MKYFFVILFFVQTQLLYAQEENQFEHFILTNHSLDDHQDYAAAYYKDYLLIIGGVVISENAEINLEKPNRNLLLFDWRTDSVIGLPLKYFDKEIAEHLSTRSMTYYQAGDTLFIIGGFGYASEKGLEMTFPAMLIIDVPKVVTSILNNKNPSPFIHQIVDERLAIQNAHLDKVDTWFFLAEGEYTYLVNGEHEYNYYNQKYDNEVRTFELSLNAETIEIKEFCIWTDIDDFFEAFEEMIPSTIFDNNEYRFKQYPNY